MILSLIGMFTVVITIMKITYNQGRDDKAKEIRKIIFDRVSDIEMSDDAMNFVREVTAPELKKADNELIRNELVSLYKQIS